MKDNLLYINNLSEINLHLAPFEKEQWFVLVDSHTKVHCLSILENALNHELKVIEVPAGEPSKCTDVLWQVMSELTENKASRKSVLLNLGGGMITDLGGFSAAIFKRGIPFFHIPTSLLAMVDAAIGGKTGINFNHFKNHIGAFSMPEKVFIYADFLITLPQREFISGLAEMLKHALIADKSHWSNLSQIQEVNFNSVQPFIEQSAQVKSDIVAQDPKEKGLRKLLNFGHTAGHAIESDRLESEAPLLHGEAIFYGMAIETLLSIHHAGLSEEAAAEILKTLNRMYPMKALPENKWKPLVEAMKQDKKNDSKGTNFTLLSDIGVGVIDIYLNDAQILKGLKEFSFKHVSL